MKNLQEIENELQRKALMVDYWETFHVLPGGEHTQEGPGLESDELVLADYYQYDIEPNGHINLIKLAAI